MRALLSNIIMPLPVFYLLLLAALASYLLKRERTSKAFTARRVPRTRIAK